MFAQVNRKNGRCSEWNENSCDNDTGNCGLSSETNGNGANKKATPLIRSVAMYNSLRRVAVIFSVKAFLGL